MKTMGELIAACEADIGFELTQMIVNSDIANRRFDQYTYRNRPSNAASCLAAAKGDIEVLSELGFPLDVDVYDTKLLQANQRDNYNVIQTLIEHGQTDLLGIPSIHSKIFENATTLEPYVQRAVSEGNVDLLRYFAKQNPESFFSAISTRGFKTSRELLEEIFFLVELEQLPLPENHEKLNKTIRLIISNTKKDVSSEQTFLSQARACRLGLGRSSEPDLSLSLGMLTDLIPMNCSDKNNLIDVAAGELDNTKVYLTYLYTQKLVPEETMSDDVCMHLLHHLEVGNLSELSVRYLKATFQAMAPSLIADMIFLDPKAEISILSAHFKFYTLLTGGYLEEALTYFESIPEEIRSGEAWFHYGVALLEHVNALPDHMIQESLEKIISALQHAEELGSDLAKNFLKKSFYKHDDGTIARTQMQVAVDGGGKRKFDAFKTAYQTLEDDKNNENDALDSNFKTGPSSGK